MWDRSDCVRLVLSQDPGGDSPYVVAGVLVGIWCKSTSSLLSVFKPAAQFTAKAYLV